MSAWVDRILKEFTADLSRLWIAADPDDVLLDERVLSGLRERGFELLPYGDSVAFRAEYEEQYRTAWDSAKDAPSKALVLHLRDNGVSDLPWDYLSRARRVSVSLADLFPKFSYTVVRQLGPEQHEALFEAYAKHATQVLGESSTKEFILTHIYKISPHLISRPEDLWRELLRLHYSDAALPAVLADHVAGVLSEIAAFKSLPLRELFESKASLLRTVQDAWYLYLSKHGVTGTRIGEPEPSEFDLRAQVPFEHPDVRVWIDSMFLDGLLHPLSVQGVPRSIPEWAKVGIVQDPLALRTLIADGIKGLQKTLPDQESSYRDWVNASRKFGEVLARFHGLDASRAEGLKTNIADLQSEADQRLVDWSRKHYANLPSLPVAKGPVMVHHIPRYLAMQRTGGSGRIALLVFDGLAIDQWVLIRECLNRRAPRLAFDESACFAWLPTLTSVSRQAIFSGLRPREFSDSIDSTASEPAQWSRFWQDQGLKANEVFYRKGLKRVDQLDELESAIGSPAIKTVGLVIDTIDEIVHGAVLGKRGIATQIESWCDSGFVDRLFTLLLSKGFDVYLTADHGNVEAIGKGRPKQGVAAETRGERVRTYRNEAIAAESEAACPGSFRINVAGLPANYQALFAGDRGGFMLQGEHAVVHGGISVEELMVPFVRIIPEKKI